MAKEHWSLKIEEEKEKRHHPQLKFNNQVGKSLPEKPRKQKKINKFRFYKSR